MNNTYLFQYCQKIVVFSKDDTAVLLAKRKGEADYDGVYSFVGGKMETTDANIIEGLRREKQEEIGTDCSIKLYTTFNHPLYFIKKDGNSMILPHYYAQFVSGKIHLNDEYSEYKWVQVSELKKFEPKIASIPETAQTLLQLKPLMQENDFVIL